MYCDCSHDYAPVLPGLFCCPGVVTLDGIYTDEDGRPLLTAAQAEATLGIRQRTVYEWRRRRYLDEVGRTDDGQKLFDAGDLGRVMANPGRREKISA